MIGSLWAIRVLFLALCTVGGFALSELRPDLISGGNAALVGVAIGFGFGGLLIALDEMLKGFSLRAFSATTLGLLLGIAVAKLIDGSGLFDGVSDDTRWLVRLGLFLAFSYIGMVLAMRSNKEDFSLIIPYVRFARRDKADTLILLDTSAVIDGRIAQLILASFVEGTILIPRFVLKELQQLSDSQDAMKRERGRRGLDMLNSIQQNPKNEVTIHDGDFPDEKDVDAKLIRLSRNLGAKLFTNDHNLGKVAALQGVSCVNLHELSRVLKPVLFAGEILTLKIVREGKDKGQGVAYMPDGTMVVVNNGLAYVGHQIEVEVQNVVQTGAGVMVFSEARQKTN
ncbi:MAG: PIN domain nuclease [Verrucomicrobia bacterium]|jgi:uncharacterized protein YacL|nr:MAG: PIN domain nuclease [Verrucomicrobiota bacterium]